MEPLIGKKTSASTKKQKVKKNGSLNDENDSSEGEETESQYGAASVSTG